MDTSLSNISFFILLWAEIAKSTVMNLVEKQAYDSAAQNTNLLGRNNLT
jgi:hypothetical protein